MTRRVFLHIGASKTGTTYLQGMCDANRAQLAAIGTLFPAPLVDHFRFMRFVFDRQGGRPPSRVARLGYDRIVAAAKDHPGSTLISNELLAAATPTQIDAVASALEPAELHVVYTIRDIARTLAAEWQQAVKGGSALRMDEFVEGVMACFDAPVTAMPTIIGESQVVEKFRMLHNVVGVLDRWSARVPADRVHLVTLPPPGADPRLLWERFCTAVDVDPATGTNPPRRRNESLGAADAEALRRVNGALAGDAGYDFTVSEWVRSKFVLPVVAAHPAQTRIAIRSTHHAWAVSRAREFVARLEGRGHHIVGELSDLLPPAEPRAGVHPDDVPEDEIVAITVGWVAGLLSRSRAADRGDAR
jgi:hypothetical protein